MDYPSTRRIIRDALVHAIPGDNTEQFWRTHTRMITVPGVTYFHTKIFGTLAGVVSLF
jgi:hypothetical protein